MNVPYYFPHTMGNRSLNPEETRTVTAGVITKQDKKRTNKIKTSKYSLLTFFPKNLSEQFRRLANFYFLIVTLIAIIIDSPVSPLTSLAPLVFVIFVTMAKQGYEDWLRHRNDKVVNNELVSVVRNYTLQDIRCQDIRPGDYVMVKRDCDVPCDLALLWTSDSRGKCFVTTANLDGETSLKPLKVPSLLTNTTLDQKINSSIKIEFVQPEADIYSFFGRMNVDDSTVVPLNTENLLLRGSRLKNTEWVIGCAIYTGGETKLALNSRFTSNKFTSCEKYINNFLLFYLVLMILEIGMSYGMKYYYEQTRIEHNIYLDIILTGSTFKNVAQDAFSFLLLYYYCIPISLYVSIEMQKFIGSLFFEWDEDLYDKETDQPPVVNTSDLNEELGQIEILFSDKTGTLTKNDMIFKMCSINGMRFIEKNNNLYEFNNSWTSGEMVQAISVLQPDVDFFFSILALCHTVQVEETSPNQTNGHMKNGFSKNGINKNDIPVYQATSSDEIAFVSSAAKRNIIFSGDDANKMFIKRNDVTESYERLNVLEFTSTRKRMSIIVRDPSGKIWLFCKGAESALIPLCLDSPTIAKINDDVQYFSEKGLRTLAVGYKQISEEEYVEINKELTKFNLGDRSKSAKNKEAVDNWRSIEQGLTLLGATAVEDRLQDDVVETMESLREAGLRIWVLTGDKIETAVNVAQSCGHIPPRTQKLFLTEMNEENVIEMLNRYEEIVNSEENSHLTLILDGPSLSWILNTPNEIKFCDISLKCEAVICCRLSPLQKALIVRLIKKSPSKPITAAIGDGANDISMIQEAHVGFGIFGKEGRQAARSSDFAFTAFKMLKKILLVHGHWYYQRLALLVQYSFYKNFVFVNLMLFYQINSNFSTQSLFDSMFLSLFNVFFAMLPILVISLSEQCHSPGLLMRTPLLYKSQSKNKLLSWKNFFGWFMAGVYHSVTIYSLCFAIWQINPVITSDGMSAEFWCFGGFVFHMLVVIVNLKLLINSRYLTAFYIFSIVISILGFVAMTSLYSSFYLMYDGDVLGTYNRLLGSLVFWLMNFLVIVACFIPDVLFLTFKCTKKAKRKHNSIAPIEMTKF